MLGTLRIYTKITIKNIKKNNNNSVARHKLNAFKDVG